MSKVFQSTKVSRADLLRCLFAGGADELDGTADALGFSRDKKQRDKPERHAEHITQPVNTKPAIVSDEEQPELPPVNQEKMHYYRITKREQLKTEGDANKSAVYPDWYTQSQETLLDAGSNSWVPKQQSLKFQSLVPWSRLWPFLHEVLSNLSLSQEPDVEKVVQNIASGKLIGQIPVKQRKTWAGTARLLIDINTATFPLRTDFIYLRDNLLKLRGDYGLQIHYLQDKPGGEIYYWDNGVERFQDWRMPKTDMPLLILSDLGLLSPSKRTLNQWLVFGFQLAIHGCRPVVLMPVPERMIDARLLKYFDCVSWDRGTERLKPLLNARPDNEKTEEHRRKTRALLTRLSPAVRVNSTLLRATRYQSMSEHIDVGHEAAAWQHPAVQACGDDFVWKASDHEQLLQAFCDLSEKQQAVMIGFIARYHATLPDVLFFEAMQNCLQLNASAVDSGIRHATQRYLAALVRTYNDYPERQALGQWVERYDVRHQASSLKRNNEILGALKGINLKRSTKVGQDIPLPKGINRELMEPFVTNARQVMRYELRQQGRNLLFVPEGTTTESSDDFGVQSSLITTLETSVDFLVKRTRTVDEVKTSHLLRFAPDQTVTIAMAGTRSYELETDREHITIEPLSKPKWAAAIGYDEKGILYADTQSRNGEVFRWYWWYADTTDGAIRKGHWFFEPDNTIPSVYWADATGIDEYGLYAESKIAGVPQRFRWIEPTTFQMGSPETEDGRDSNETKHQVTLSQGYWLADTTCTQQLWQAVMGDNPSNFKGETNPVEQVSWDDIQKFLQRIKKQQPELELRLPTEAEWENACRAGTETPFHFGEKDDLNLEKVNYSSKWDGYSSDGKTKPVKSYPPNQWGLYEMHGNVFEWCEDWYGEYPEELVVDPQGAESGGYSVLRGGSWFNSGGNCRSAYRRSYRADSRDYFYGFRLARGHDQPPVRTVRAGQQQTGRFATREQGGQAGDDQRPRSMAPSSNKSDDKASKGFFGSILDKFKR